MWEFLFSIDQSLFSLINRVLSNGLFDWFFPFITDLHHNALVKFGVFPILIAYFIYRRRLEAVILVFGLIICLAWVDFSGGQIIKPFFERLRPSVQGLDVVLRCPHYNGFSFISNHAANMFAAAVYTIEFSKLWGRIVLIFAFLIAYSRVYCGVHFPADVIAGALYGGMIGVFFAAFSKFLIDRVLNKSKPAEKKTN